MRAGRRTDHTRGDHEGPHNGLLVDLDGFHGSHRLLIGVGSLSGGAESAAIPLLVSPAAIEVSIGLSLVNLGLDLFRHGE